jgi:2-C-methyl-D-erythritol 4-phosphate cytidylyltransferase
LPRDVGVVVVAAGKGTRLGSGILKQYRPLAGIPVVLRALRPFTAHPDVAQVVLVLPPTEASAPPGFLAELQGSGLVLTAGGEERSESVAAGLATLRRECTVVLVHDAARPFVDRAVIDEVIRGARAGEGAIAAVPLTDTLKEADPEDPSRIARTLPRDRLWRAQTPQGFPRHLLERAQAHAREHSITATDDAAMVEACGGTVRLIHDTQRNLKITTAEDFALAELLARPPA